MQTQKCIVKTFFKPFLLEEEGGEICENERKMTKSPD